MAQIHWSIWFLIGLGVTIWSALQEGFGIFIVVGAIFMVFGIIKFMTRGEPKKGESKTEEPKQGRYTKCTSCGAFNYPQAQRCHNCSKMLQ